MPSNKSALRIQKGLVHLLQRQVPFDDIQVKHIVNEADIARATFYLHYASKEEVLIDYIDIMFERFFEQVESAFSSTQTINEAVARKVFEVFQEEADFSRVMLEERVQPILLKRFKGYLARIVGHVARTNQQFNVSDRELGFLVDYWAGGSYLLLIRWIASEFEPGPDEMAKLYTQLTISGMKSLLPE